MGFHAAAHPDGSGTPAHRHVRVGQLPDATHPHIGRCGTRPRGTSAAGVRPIVCSMRSVGWLVVADEGQRLLDDVRYEQANKA